MDMEKINIELESIDKKADLIYEEIKECLKESNDKNIIVHKEQSFEDKSAYYSNIPFKDLMDELKDNRNNIVFLFVHHTDMDGDCSASVAETAIDCYVHPLPLTTKFLRINYSRKEDVEETIADIQNTGNKVCLIETDLSICPETIPDYFIWIDHHATSLSLFNSLKKKIEDDKSESKVALIVNTSVSAALLCRLVFRDCFDVSIYTLVINMLTDVVSVYDTKKDKQYPNVYNNASVYLNQYYYDMGHMRAEDGTWLYLFYDEDHIANLAPLKEDYVPKFIDCNTEDACENIDCTWFDNYEWALYIINIGHKLFDINEQKNKVLYDSECIYRKKIGDYEVVGMEGKGSSIRFNPYKPQAKNTVYCLMNTNNPYSVIFSMFSDSDEIKKKNLGNFMKKYFGGGGHPGAAGANVRKKDMREMIKSTESETVSDYNKKMEGFSVKFTPRYDATTKDQFAYIFNCLFEYLGI